MSEFTPAQLGSLVLSGRSITYGIVQPGPDVSPNGVPLIRGKDYSSGKVDASSLYHVLESIDRPYVRSKVRGGDILLSIVGYVGQTAIVPDELTGANITQTTARISIDPKLAVGAYVFHLLRSPHFQPEIRRYEKGSAQPGLNLKDVEKLRLKLAPHSEQPAIARVLSAVDDLIDKTAILSDKLRSIKRGLMEDLLSRGVDVNGKLRPRREAALSLYKESIAGWIPREWNAESLSYYVPKAVYGLSESLDGSDQGIPILRMNNLNDGKIDVSDLKYVGAPVSQTLLLKPGDVLFNRTNSIEHVGKTALWRGELPQASFASYLVRLDVDPNRMTPSFLCHWLNAEKSQIAIRRFATPGVHQVNINPTNLRRIVCAAPKDLKEQTAICERIDAVEKMIAAQERSRSKLLGEQRGLATDLLTGRVRIAASRPDKEAA